MKILAFYLIAALVSTSLAKSADKRKTRTKVRSHATEEAHRNRHPQRSSWQGHNSEEDLRGHNRKLRIPYVDEGNREKPKIPYVDERNRRKPNTFHGDKEIHERRPRQSLFPIPQLASLQPGGNHHSGGFRLNSPLTLPSLHHNRGSSAFSQGPLPQFIRHSQGGHPGNHEGGARQDNPGVQGGHNQGNQGGQLFPGTISVPNIGNQGGGSIFQPVSSLFSPGPSHTSGSLTSGSSSVGGPGGLNSSPDSGLAGGVGGAYGGGYGLGIGGLVFGGANGPVFAGNAPIIDGLGVNTYDGDDEEDDSSENQKDAPQTPPVRPERPTNGILYPYNRGIKNNKDNSLDNQSAQNTYPIDQSRPNAVRNEQGETIGYVAFIFPRRSSNKPNSPLTEHSRGAETHTPANAAPKSKSKASAKPKINRFPPVFVPLPVQIPIDRPYLIPVPYEVAKPFPVAVPVEVPKPAHVDVPVLVSQPNLFLQPSILHKRSDKVAKPS